jgi:hypothetical protein
MVDMTVDQGDGLKSVVILLQKGGGIGNRVVMTVIREWVKVGGNSITKKGGH